MELRYVIAWMYYRKGELGNLVTYIWGFVLLVISLVHLMSDLIQTTKFSIAPSIADSAGGFSFCAPVLLEDLLFATVVDTCPALNEMRFYTSPETMEFLHERQMVLATLSLIPLPLCIVCIYLIYGALKDLLEDIPLLINPQLNQIARRPIRRMG